MVRAVARFFLALAALAVLTGCSTFDTGTAALDRAVELLECPRDRVTMTPVSDYSYTARGCGAEVAIGCTAGRLEPVCLRQSATATAGGEAAEGEPVRSEAPPEIEERIRAGLEARREDVVGCVGRAPVGVRASFDADGAVVFNLQGDLERSPEERCVQDALGGVRVAATGAPGVVVHLVR